MILKLLQTMSDLISSLLMKIDDMKTSFHEGLSPASSL